MSHIILGGSANALAIARLLKDPNSIILDFNDCSPAMSTKYAKGLRLLSKNEQEVLETLLSLKAPPPKTLYPTSDYWVEFIAKNSSTLQEHGFLFFKTPYNCSETILDKLKFFQIMSPCFPTPLTRLADKVPTRSEEIIKPRKSFIDSSLVDKGFLYTTKYVRNASTYVKQQRLNSNIYNHLSIAGLFLAGKLHTVIYTRKLLEYPHPGGTAVMVSTIDSEEIRARLRKLAESALRHISYEGIFELEAILEDETLWLIEINGRFWLQHAIGEQLGINFPKLYHQALTGCITPTEAKSRVTALWIHEGLPLAFLKAPSYMKKIVLKELLKKRNWAFAHIDLKDLTPFIKFIRCKLKK